MQNKANKTCLMFGILGLNILPNSGSRPSIESRVENITAAHPAATTAACATVAKGGCAAVKVVKAGSIALTTHESDTSKDNPNKE
jgi:hypothetical protein